MEPVNIPPLSEDQTFAQMAANHPETTAKVVRTLLIEDAQRQKEQSTDTDNSETELPARQKIAIAAISLGQEISANIVKYLTDHEIEQISQSISELDVVAQELEDRVLREFKQRLLSGKFISQGGPDFAQGMLTKALGPRKGQQILNRVNSTTASGFYLLRNVDPNQIIPFISKEHPQTIALILSQLDSAQAAGVLNGLPEEMQADVTFRIAQMDNISPQVLRDLEENLVHELQAILSGQITEIGGPKAAAEILNHVSRTTKTNVLSRLEKQNQGLTEQVQNQMFTFDDIATLADRELDTLLQDVAISDLAVAIQGTNPEFVEHIRANLSDEGRADLNREVQELSELLGSEVEEMQLQILQIVRKLEEAGKLRIVRGNEVKVVVKQ